MIFIYNFNNSISAGILEMLYDLLPASLKQKANKRQGHDKAITIIEYFALKNLLNFKGLPDFEYNKNGKPSLKNHAFSIAHCNNVLCIATSSKNNQIGVDIQDIKDYDEKIAKFVCNQHEFEMLNKSKNKNLAFAKLFVKKEATIKCLGLTLGSSLKDILQSNNSCNFNYTFKKHKNYIICECQTKI